MVYDFFNEKKPLPTGRYVIYTLNNPTNDKILISK